MQYLQVFEYMTKYEPIHRARYKALPAIAYLCEIKSPQIKMAESSKTAGLFLPPEKSESLSFLFDLSNSYSR
jgi:hypothetical protein